MRYYVVSVKSIFSVITQTLTDLAFLCFSSKFISCTYLDISVLLIHNNYLENYVKFSVKLMRDYNKFNKGNTGKI